MRDVLRIKTAEAARILQGRGSVRPGPRQLVVVEPQSQGSSATWSLMSQYLREQWAYGERLRATFLKGARAVGLPRTRVGNARMSGKPLRAQLLGLAASPIGMPGPPSGPAFLAAPALNLRSGQ